LGSADLSVITWM